MKITIMMSTGDMIDIEVNRFDTFEDVCTKMVEQANLRNIEKDKVFFSYYGKRLELQKSLSDYDIQDGEMITALIL